MTDLTPEQEEKLLRDAEIKQRDLAKRQRDDLIHVMDSPQGRRVVWNLLTKAGVFAISFTGDNNTTNFNEGRRSEGLRLFSDVMIHCPELYMTMAKEASDDESSTPANTQDAL